MIPRLCIEVLNHEEITKIHAAMVSILSRTGIAVEHSGIREALLEYGAQIDHETQRMRFPETSLTDSLTRRSA